MIPPTKRLYFQKHDGAPTALGQALLEWHAGLEDDRQTRARLQRAADPAAVSWEPGFYGFLARMKPFFDVESPEVRQTLAALAGLAARVRVHVPGIPLPVEMSQPQEKPRVSELRFRRLLALDSLDERYDQLARVIDLLDRRVNLCSLADAVVYWSRDTGLRQRWAYDYFKESA